MSLIITAWHCIIITQMAWYSNTNYQYGSTVTSVIHSMRSINFAVQGVGEDGEHLPNHYGFDYYTVSVYSNLDITTLIQC